MSPKEHPILRSQVDELISKGPVQVSVSPCTILTLLTPKKDESWYLCTDKRLINRITVNYRFPLHWLDDILEKLEISKILNFSKPNLKSGYPQISIHPGNEKAYINAS